MARKKARGSLVYEILIVLLAIVLIGTLLYPKTVWNNIDHETTLCRDHMLRIADAEDLARSFREDNRYDTSLVELFSFIRNDSFWFQDSIKKTLRDSFYVKLLVDYFRDYEDIATKKASDSATSQIEKPDSLRQVNVDSILNFMVNNLYTCPTVKDTYLISVVDTAQIPVVTVKCPITKAQEDSINSDFWFHVIGGGKITNHGSVENGEPTWTKEKRK